MENSGELLHAADRWRTTTEGAELVDLLRSRLLQSTPRLTGSDAGAAQEALDLEAWSRRSLSLDIVPPAERATILSFLDQIVVAFLIEPRRREAGIAAMESLVLFLSDPASSRMILERR